MKTLGIIAVLIFLGLIVWVGQRGTKRKPTHSDHRGAWSDYNDNHKKEDTE